jgi:hypothetical protein
MALGEVRLLICTSIVKHESQAFGAFGILGIRMLLK